MGMESALDIISNFLFYYHFIQSHFLSRQAPASVASVTYSQEKARHWFLFLKIFQVFAFICMLFFEITFLKIFSVFLS